MTMTQRKTLSSLIEPDHDEGSTLYLTQEQRTSEIAKILQTLARRAIKQSHEENQ